MATLEQDNALKEAQAFLKEKNQMPQGQGVKANEQVEKAQGLKMESLKPVAKLELTPTPENVHKVHSQDWATGNAFRQALHMGEKLDAKNQAEEAHEEKQAKSSLFKTPTPSPSSFK